MAFIIDKRYRGCGIGSYVLENEKIQFEVVEAIKDGIKKGKLSKTGIAIVTLI